MLLFLVLVAFMYNVQSKWSSQGSLGSSFVVSVRLLPIQFAMPCGASGIKEAKKALKNTHAVHRRGRLTGVTGTAIMAGSTTSASSTSAGGGTFRTK